MVCWHYRQLACRVLDAMGDHVGNLKWARGVWKFKAVGHDASGAVIPSGGPLPDRHVTMFATLDLVQINRAHGPALNAPSTHHDLIGGLGGAMALPAKVSCGDARKNPVPTIKRRSDLRRIPAFNATVSASVPIDGGCAVAQIWHAA